MGKLKDMTGMKFGRLTVIERRGSDKHRHSLWLCKCECGNEVVKNSSDLRKGHTTSCGCYNREVKVDLIGQRFGRLVVVSYNEEITRTKKGTYWNCKCECGNEVVICGGNLRSGGTTSCGCYQREIVAKGGITPIRKYLRDLPVVEQWINDCKKQANYTCELTGKVGANLNTHHLKAFNTIVLEAHELNNIQIHEIIGEYTQEELHKLKEYVVSWHEDNLNAIVLCKEVHKLFHSLYGQGDNTPEQFEDFKQRYLNGEFKDLLGDGLDD